MTLPAFVTLFLSFMQDNSGALLQDEEYIITEDLRSGMDCLLVCNCPVHKSHYSLYSET